MKLALLTPAPPLRGGPVQYAAQLYQALVARGHAVRVFGFRRQYPSLLFPGRHQLDLSKHAPELPNQPVFDPLSPLSWIHTARQISELRPNGVLIQYWMPFFAPGFGAVAWMTRRWTRTSVMLLIHNFYPHEFQPGGQWLTRWLLDRCSGFILQSEATRRELLALKPAAKHVLVPHPVHHIFECHLTRAEARARLGLAGGSPLLLFFGYVRTYKGLPLLLEAMTRVREMVPDIHLLIAGEFYADRRPYERQIASLRLTEAVTLVDRFIPCEEVGLYFVAADLVVLPYLRATQSGIVPIAYAHERAVVVTSVGGLPEQVADGETGYVVPPGDPTALAKAIVRFFTQADREALAARIRARREQYTWDRLAEAVEALVCDLD